MDYPCKDDPNEVVEKVVEAKADASKFNTFVNGTDSETVQLGAGEPTPSIRNVVRQIRAKTTEFAQILEDSALDTEGTDLSLRNAVAAGTTMHRTLATRFSDILNVKDYGAVGNGTTDDTTAWTAWKTALQSGGIGYVPAGTYLVYVTEDNEQVAKLYKVPHGCIGTLDAINDIVYLPNGEITESNSLINSTRNAAYAEGTVSAPHIAIRDTATHIDDDAENTENFIRGVGIYEELKITGRSANPSEAATQNFSGIYAVTRNEAKGWIGGTSVQARYYEGNDPTDVNWKNNKGAALGAISWGYGKHSQGGYCAGAEIDMIEQYDGEQSCPIYQNDDSRSAVNIQRQTRALLLGVGGMQPVLDGMVVVGFSGDLGLCGCWNGITIGGTAMKINGQAGVAGTVGLNLATWRTGSYGDVGIKFGKANRHISAVEGLKIASNYSNFVARQNGAAVVRLISGDDSNSVMPSTVEFYSYDDVANYSSLNDAAEREAHATFHGSIGHTPTGMQLRSVLELKLRVDGTVANADPAYVVFDKVSLRPGYSTSGNVTTVNSISLGQADAPWANVRATTGPWASSDARKKDIVETPSDALMRAWGKVGFKVFQFKDAVATKGVAEARLHVGVIAQEVQAAFASEGLDVSRYGLFGYDSWDDEYEDVRVVDAEAVLDENEEIVTPEQAHVERRLVHPAGDAYSIRYEEALALECAYQRWLGEQRDARIAALEARLAGSEE